MVATYACWSVYSTQHQRSCEHELHQVFSNNGVVVFGRRQGAGAEPFLSLRYKPNEHSKKFKR